LAVGLGLKAIEHGYPGLFTTAAALITTLTKAGAEGRLDEKLKLYTVPRLLIVDEIGYLPSTATAPTSSSNSSAGARAGSAALDQQPELRELGGGLRRPGVGSF